MSPPLYLAFIWHMHQPYYRDPVTGECSMPWVRLHGTKDYLDMVKVLEGFPTIHQTFNLVPSLIDQLEEYLPPANLSDHFLDLSRKPAADLTASEKRFLLEWFFLANWDQMVKPYPRYHDLLVKRGLKVHEEAWSDAVKQFKVQDCLDLQVWFNLAWIDPWLRQQDPQLAALEAKGSQFTEADKQLVLSKHLDILQQILPVYRAAQERGQIELTTSPYYHPIVPLLCDVRQAQVALPHLPLPQLAFRHAEDAHWHLTSALKRHEALFGKKPSGCWPPEGSVSEELVHLAIEMGLRWIATDEDILWRTLKTSRSLSVLYRPHLLRRKGGQVAIVFRDRELSDLIGFVYSQWEASIAVQDFIARLEGIHKQFTMEKTPALISIILDGENAWESYPRDGHDFLQGLYRRLADDSRFRVVTVNEFLDQFPPTQSPSLPELFAGSWIDGNFATWIGHPEKNAAWEHLAQTRDALVALEKSKGLNQEALDKAWRSFYIAEGSDWMWWLGDTHSSAQDEEFDRLFRTHTANVYRWLNQEVPASLQLPIKTKVIHPIYEPTAPIHPVIDGVETTYYEWLYAGRLDLRKGYVAMHRGTQILQAFCYGFDETQHYFRVDVDGPALARCELWHIQCELLDRQATLSIRGKGAERISATLEGPQPQSIPCAYQRVIELSVPKAVLSVKPGETLQMHVTFYRGKEPLERYPAHGAFSIPIPSSDFEAQSWSA